MKLYKMWNIVTVGKKSIYMHTNLSSSNNEAMGHVGDEAVNMYS